MEFIRTKICVVGLGYIGLPTAATLATRGHEVVGLEVSQHVVDTINKGKAHIIEPDLDMLVSGAVSAGRLRAVIIPEEAEAFIIAVPTPLRDKQPDISYIMDAVETIAPVLQKGNIIILESTSPIGTTETIVRKMAELRPDLHIPASRNKQGDLSFVHCPERVLPGKIIRELVENDRILGGYYPTSAEQAAKLYSSFVHGEMLLTDDKTAELTKLVENASRDVNIAFANELSMICDQMGINVWNLIQLANRHPRVNILQPGPGVGGHCIAVDPWFIVDAAPEAARLIRTARQVNEAKPDHVAAKVRTMAERFKHPVIACLGLAFKADIDDLRESPALAITMDLARHGVGEVLAVEPYIRELPRPLSEAGVVLCDLDEALNRADIVVLLVDHKPFVSVPRDRLSQKVLIDTRGVWR